MPNTVNNILDFGSILAFIEHNFKLGFIGASTGTGPYSHYADYQAEQTGRGKLSQFFTLRQPKAFTKIASPVSARDFIDAPPSKGAPDND